MTKRLTFILLALIVAVVVAAVALTMDTDDTRPAKQATEDVQKFVAGRDYMIIGEPVVTIDPNKIEVTEVFWYGCGHCNTFRPVFEQWTKQLPEYVVTRHSPAMWNETMNTHARIFYTATTLGVQEAMHKTIFDAIHLQKQKLLNADEIYALFAPQGITRENFDDAFKSFGVRSMVQQANARARSYGIAGTPELVVNGKYRISTRMTGSHTRMLEAAEYLISRERESMKTREMEATAATG